MFAEQLKTARKARGHTQASLADVLNVSKGAVAMWETGKRQPSIEKLSELSVILNVSTDYLIKGSAALCSIPCRHYGTSYSSITYNENSNHQLCGSRLMSINTTCL